MKYSLSNIPVLFALIIGAGCGAVKEQENQVDFKSSDILNLTKFVDPYIGTGFHGHVFMGANVPFGGVQLGPTNLTEGWDWCSGYHYSDSTVIGFAHTHLSGTGIGDLGDILFMPTTGALNIHRGTKEKPDKGYLAYYSHEDEIAKAGYYSVWLDKYKVKAELTATARVGFHRYTFEDSEGPCNIIIDLERGIGWDLPLEGHIEQINDTTILGYRYSKGWAVDQKIYFAAVFSQPVSTLQLFNKDSLLTTDINKSSRLKGALSFDLKDEKELLVKVGISPVNSENALENILSEIPHWQFDETVAAANASWNSELNKIKVKFQDERKVNTFYTAMYHAMIAPSVFNDINGAYRGADGAVYQDTTFINYTTFSLWDTYRAANPLYTIIQPERIKDMITTMLRIYQHQGKLPVWHLMGNETNTMVGYSAVPIIVDAYFKGHVVEVDLAYEAVKASAMGSERGLDHIQEKGFIPADTQVESVAKGLEYAISDWCIAQMAKDLGHTEDYDYFMKRAGYYKNYFDKEAGFMRGRISENKWRQPFNPFKSVHMKDDFCEGNAWQYTWLVPHDVEGLVALLGGKEAFISKLDELFVAEGDLGEEASADITGLIGQYAHGNEPSHHITYLYPYVGQPWKTAEKVRFIMEEFYTPQPDGIIGNEDVGQMSSWYILSALGFYPANPANGVYVFGSPLIDDAEIAVGNGKTFNIRVKNNSEKNIYVQTMTLNGKHYNKSFIKHEDLLKGGTLTIEMGPAPSEEFGVDASSWPQSTSLPTPGD